MCCPPTCSSAAPPMAETSNWAFPPRLQPRPEELRFDLGSALQCVVLVHAEIPEDAFTAAILGTERIGHGTVIGADGLVLTIGYLITEAESIWLTTNDGTVVPGHALDRKSTRLNSSHGYISYAVFCLKKKKNT